MKTRKMRDRKMRAPALRGGAIKTVSRTSALSFNLHGSVLSQTLLRRGTLGKVGHAAGGIDFERGKGLTQLSIFAILTVYEAATTAAPLRGFAHARAFPKNQPVFWNRGF